MCRSGNYLNVLAGHVRADEANEERKREEKREEVLGVKTKKIRKGI